MAFPAWHNKDYGRVPDEKPILDALAGVKSGQYLVPFADWGKLTAEERTELQKLPAALLLVRNPGTFAFAKVLGQYFVFVVFVLVMVAYLTGHTRAPGADSLEVFRVAGTIAFATFALRGFPDSIWYGKPWKVTMKELVDGLLYSILVGAVFAWLWPA
ncbi:MAG TPA: hypothetical protein VGQ76_25550 [Thermoanaerobaculia bacterium]|jgi:hypothetical protein|nr:hypothetical protein [Thermoanaerobaculia bacterium]